MITPYINTVEIIRALDDEPNDVGGLSAEQLKTKFDQFAQEFSDYHNDTLIPELNAQTTPYAVATGSANTYAVTLTPGPTSYTDGFSVCVKINADSTGASTLNINSLGEKAILDSSGNAITAGGLKNGLPYVLRYNGSNFIVQGKGGGGNATADKLLSGYTASVDIGPITGSMPNKVGSGTVITPTTSDRAITQGYYGGALTDGKVKGDSNLLASNIKNGVSIFGITGNLTTGKAFFAGTVTTDGSASMQITGLSFRPAFIICQESNNFNSSNRNCAFILVDNPNTGYLGNKLYVFGISNVAGTIYGITSTTNFITNDGCNMSGVASVFSNTQYSYIAIGA